MKLIDKDQIVAEIEKCYNECLKRAKVIDYDYWSAKADAYRNVLVILYGTLEVKKVKIEPHMDLSGNGEPCKDLRFGHNIFKMFKAGIFNPLIGYNNEHTI